MEENTAEMLENDWDADIDGTQDDTPEDEPEAAEAESENAEQEPDQEKEDPEEKPENAGQKETDQFFELKHLGETKRVGKDEIVPLAQKGMDYDRVKGKLEELNATVAKNAEAVSFLEELAKQQNMTPEQFVEDAQAEKLAARDGIDKATALKQVQLERREKALSQREAATTQQKREMDTEKQEQEKRNQEMMEFLKAYTEVDPKTIPKEVWADVSRGMTLLNAYARYDIGQREAKLKTDTQNYENKVKSTGSRKSAGEKQPEEKWFAGWDD